MKIFEKFRTIKERVLAPVWKVSKRLPEQEPKNPDKARLPVNFPVRKKLTLSWQPFPLHTLAFHLPNGVLTHEILAGFLEHFFQNGGEKMAIYRLNTSNGQSGSASPHADYIMGEGKYKYKQKEIMYQA